MAANGASSVKGGNRQLFEHFVANSNARVHLNTRVRSIERLQRPGTVDGLNVALPDPSQRPWLIRYEDVDSGRSAVQAYDAIIFGSPLHSAEASSVPEVQFINVDIPSRVPVLPYVDLHVTLLVTNATSPRPEFFGKKGEKISRSILSTFESYEAGKSQTRPTINSLNYLKSLPKMDEATGQRHVVKSEHSVSLQAFRCCGIFADGNIQSSRSTSLLRIFSSTFLVPPNCSGYTEKNGLPTRSRRHSTKTSRT
jgi:hypothetical protein